VTQWLIALLFSNALLSSAAIGLGRIGVFRFWCGFLTPIDRTSDVQLSLLCCVWSPIANMPSPLPGRSDEAYRSSFSILRAAFNFSGRLVRCQTYLQYASLALCVCSPNSSNRNPAASLSYRFALSGNLQTYGSALELLLNGSCPIDPFERG